MKNLAIAILVMVVSFQTFAERIDEDSVDPLVSNQYQNTLYLHPLSLIISAAADIIPFALCVTYERALAPQTSLILTPALIAGTVSDPNSDASIATSEMDLGIGIRHYLSRPGSGIYLQAKANAGYATIELEDYVDYEWKTAKGSGMGFSILGYIGGKGQWGRTCMFLDAGIGYQYIGAEVTLEGSDVTKEATKSGLGYDFNYALGVAF